MSDSPPAGRTRPSRSGTSPAGKRFSRSGDTPIGSGHRLHAGRSSPGVQRRSNDPNLGRHGHGATVKNSAMTSSRSAATPIVSMSSRFVRARTSSPPRAPTEPSSFGTRKPGASCGLCDQIFKKVTALAFSPLGDRLAVSGFQQIGARRHPRRGHGRRAPAAGRSVRRSSHCIRCQRSAACRGQRGRIGDDL